MFLTQTLIIGLKGVLDYAKIKKNLFLKVLKINNNYYSKFIINNKSKYFKCC